VKYLEWPKQKVHFKDRYQSKEQSRSHGLSLAAEIFEFFVKKWYIVAHNTGC